MASFVIMEPPEARKAKAGANAAERTLFVRDGFSVMALILPFPWLLIYRLWFEAALVLAAAVALGLAGEHWNIGAPAAVLSFLVSILVALEGSNWRLAALRRRGYTEKGVIEASDRAEAEIRYFAEDVSGNETSTATPVPAARAERPALPVFSPPGGTVGLVGYPRGN
ncbi:DUF2628 domain-containing protein [Phyllobacterium salinisoli]|uniref:DUF2628 domain-containing protein n=1 Tax=Phyllobacterium salinisoli TaxID=1899321 RepID=A0A368K1I9_9HYPH|nr:DUF2628 domain-containing protein [Phyllobacterium salinisoli]RCS22333.1 DUF2628 domain-containing protein [Phyllobacterium salinisoli]